MDNLFTTYFTWALGLIPGFRTGSAAFAYAHRGAGPNVRGEGLARWIAAGRRQLVPTY